LTAGAIVGASRGRAVAETGTAPLRIQRDPFRLCLFLLTIVTVSRVHQHWHAIAVLRPALVLAVFSVAYAFLNPKYLETANLRYWPARLIAAIGIWACISAPFGISLGGSASYILFEFSKTLAFAFLVIVAIRGASDLYTFVWAYVISSTILCYFSIFVFGLSRASGSYAERLSNLYTFDANDVGLVLLIGLSLTLLAFQTSRGKAKVFAGVTLLAIGATLARTGSRGAFVGLVAFGLATLVLLKTVPLAKRLASLAAVIIALVAFAPEGYWEQMATLVTPTQDYNWNTRDGRREVAKRGIGYMLSYPIFGLGMKNFWRAECFLSEKAQTHVAGTGLRCTPPHNSYLEAGSELGLPGLAMWVSLVFGCIGAGLRIRRRLPARWSRGDPEERFLYLASMYIPLAMISFAVTSLFLTFAWLDMVYFVAALTVGLYVAVERKRRGSLVAAPAAGRRPAAPVAAGPPASPVLMPRSRRRGAPVEPQFLTPPE
jgi:O-antigen ligase